MTKYPNHLSSTPAYYRKHLGKPLRTDLPDNPGCKVQIGILYQPAIKITPAIEIHVPRNPSLAEETWWGVGIIGGFFSFIFLSHIFFG